MSHLAAIHSAKHVPFSTERQVERNMSQAKTGIGAVEKEPMKVGLEEITKLNEDIGASRH